ncbi:hypothetical protein G6F65_017503 [Rhizopus arrhizus]|nr:hypothetical protein G6F65_017503 [Rhizopus arrhizus]
MKEIAGNIAAAHGCEADVFFERRYPALVNTVAETEFCMGVMRDVVGEDRALTIEPAMASEDFAFLLQEKPGCYVFLGNGDGEHRMAGHGLGPCMLHNASYDFNDALIPAGASYWVRLAQRIPVRVKIDDVPDGVRLVAGQTATVSVDPKPAQAASADTRQPS